jgi:hypothetical protein
MRRCRWYPYQIHFRSLIIIFLFGVFFMFWLVPWNLEKSKQARKLGIVKGVADLARQSKEKPNRMEWKRRKV